MLDAHTHLRDARLRPYLPRLAREAMAAGVSVCLDCTARAEEWDYVPPTLPLALHQAFGLHPWHLAEAPADWPDRLDATLRAHPRAPLGEIGLDGLRKPADGGAAQRAALATQLALAARLGRPVILHGARAWGALLDTLAPWAPRLPALLLHGVSFAPDLLAHPTLRRANVWFGIGAAVLNPAAKAAPRLTATLPADRLLLETDTPDCFPRGGEPLILGQPGTPLNHPANLPLILHRVAALRRLPAHELADQTTTNARAFLATF